MSARKSRKANRVAADLLDRYRELLPPLRLQALEIERLTPTSSAIRINPLKADPAAEIEYLASYYGWQVTPVSFCSTGWEVNNSRPSQTVEYRLGYYFIQDTASMLPVELFDFDFIAEPMVLDLAAAPGGKTTHLVSRAGDHGLIVANDVSAARLPGLRASLQSWGAMHAAITHFPGELFGGWFPEAFDRVLLDAPCSMENLRPSRSHRQRQVSPRERRSLSQRQVNLFASAIRSVKPGGQVVYATCTLAPEEDEAVVDDILHLFPGLIQVEDVSSQVGKGLGGLASFNDRVFDPAVAQAARLWPDTYGTSGFFSALLTKKDSCPTDRQPAPFHPLADTRFECLTPAKEGEITAIIENDYGFDLSALVEGQSLSLWQRDGFIMAFPEVFLQRFSGLPFYSLGLPLGEFTSGSFTPTQEFCARFGLEFERGKFVLDDDLIQDWLERKSLALQVSPDALPTSKVIVVVNHQGRNLGRGRLSEKNLKSL